MRKVFSIAALTGFCLLTLTTGCDKLTDRPMRLLNPGVREAAQWEMSSCEYLGEVEGRALARHAKSIKPLSLAKGDAIKAAANLGATHVVWVEQENGPPARIKAKAYRCTR